MRTNLLCHIPSDDQDMVTAGSIKASERTCQLGRRRIVSLGPGHFDTTRNAIIQRRLNGRPQATVGPVVALAASLDKGLIAQCTHTIGLKYRDANGRVVDHRITEMQQLFDPLLHQAAGRDVRQGGIKTQALPVAPQVRTQLPEQPLGA